MSVLSSERIMVENEADAVYRLSLEEGWGDGMPVIPPTDERILAMLAAVQRDAREVICDRVPPKDGIATVELVAINAVMAGCEPQAFPLVLAAFEAVLAPAFNPSALFTTTGSVTPMVLVNGPCRDELKIDYKAGCLGGAAGRGSMTIGRALQLCLRNLGGMRAGESSRTVFGQPSRSGLCFGEWEERSPWPSLGARRGFSKQQNVVTVHGGMGTVPVCDVSTPTAEDLIWLIGRCIAMPMTNLQAHAARPDGETVVLINPIWGERLGAAFPRVESFQECLFENSWQSIDVWPESVQGLLEERGRVDSRGRVYAPAGPERIVPIVCGGLGNLHGTILPSWGESQMQSRAI
jgi:hypothetical protein